MTSESRTILRGLTLAPSVRRVLPWVLFSATLVLAAAAALLTLLNRSTEGMPEPIGEGGTYLIMPLTASSVGLLLTLRVPRNAVSWLFACVALLAATDALAYEYAGYGTLTESGAVPAAEWAAWLFGWDWVFLVAAAAVLLPLLFPDGRFLSRRWRNVALVCCAGVIIGSITSALAPGPMDEFKVVDNPLGLPSQLKGPIQAVSVVGILVVLGCVPVAAASQFVRYRRAPDDVRHQIKWFLAAVALLTAFLATLPVLHFVAPDADGLRKLVETGYLLSFSAIPAAAAIAILRYRLYDIDIIINRAFVYVPLSAILAGVYIAITGLFRTIFTDAADAGSDAAIAFSTLVIVALLTPLKNQLQTLVDQRFKEAPPAAKEFAKLTDAARSYIEVADLQRFVARFLELAVDAHDARGGVVEVGASMAGLRSCQHGDWPAEPALALELSHEGHTYGVLTLGPRRSSRPYTAADREALQRGANVVAQVIHVQTAASPSGVGASGQAP